MTLAQMRLHLEYAELENERQMARFSGAVSLAIGASMGDDKCADIIQKMQR